MGTSGDGNFGLLRITNDANWEELFVVVTAGPDGGGSPVLRKRKLPPYGDDDVWFGFGAGVEGSG